MGLRYTLIIHAFSSLLLVNFLDRFLKWWGTIFSVVLSSLTVKTASLLLFCRLVVCLKVVTGDYVAYVHIIEVRELKGEDLQVKWWKNKKNCAAV